MTFIFIVIIFIMVVNNGGKVNYDHNAVMFQSFNLLFFNYRSFIIIIIGIFIINCLLFFYNS